MKITLIIFAILLSGCTTTEKTAPQSNYKLSKNEQMLHEAQKLIVKKQPQKAIDKYLNSITNKCGNVYKNLDASIFIARSLTENIYYMATAAKNKKNASVIQSHCNYAFLIKGAAHIDLKQLDQAKHNIEIALKLSPVNTIFWSELGHIYQMEENWEKALEIFVKAEDYAETFSPEQSKKIELLRAKRGIAYSLVELGRLDEAENIYNNCLEIDPKDVTSMVELNYIKKLRFDKKQKSTL